MREEMVEEELSVKLDLVGGNMNKDGEVRERVPSDEEIPFQF